MSRPTPTKKEMRTAIPRLSRRVPALAPRQESRSTSGVSRYASATESTNGMRIACRRSMAV